MLRPFLSSLCLALYLCLQSTSPGQQIVLADFEGTDFGNWVATGAAFGERPAPGTLPNQMAVSGFQGSQLASSFHAGDESTGQLESPKFVIERAFLSFLIAGGNDVATIGVELIIDGQVVQQATGEESEHLLWQHWDVSRWQGKTGTLRVYDRATGGWGHIAVDQFELDDQPRPRFAQLDELLQEYRQSPFYLQEPRRPQFHFSPEIHWMNDPNGLVYFDGEYHLFYQYNPAGNAWGHMSWGHAVSRDLTHWQHLPLAIPEADGVMAFSGCCVVDHNNSAGFAGPGQTALVAIYTGHRAGNQSQFLAYSVDAGRSWQTYADNPVLDIDQADFRDPKVFWHSAANRWVMVVSLAVEKTLVFYGSADLKQWTELSRFGPAGHPEKSNWECPDLFELPIENEAGQKLWVLEADMGSGSIAGGSGGEYFVGTFDGERFESLQAAQWVDYGRDFYAPVSWSDLPDSDGRRIWLGWFNNWETCLNPTAPWRSCMSVPRSLSLRRVETEQGVVYRLVQTPVRELEQLRGKLRELDASNVTWPPRPLTQLGDLDHLSFELQAQLNVGSARSCGFRIRTNSDEYLEIGYDSQGSVVYVDRRHSGEVDFHPAFAGRHEAPVRVIDGKVALHILIDRSTAEVFINDGEQVIGDLFFPRSERAVIEAFAGDSTASIDAIKLYPLNSSWKEAPASRKRQPRD